MVISAKGDGEGLTPELEAELEKARLAMVLGLAIINFFEVNGIPPGPLADGVVEEVYRQYMEGKERRGGPKKEADHGQN